MNVKSWALACVMGVASLGVVQTSAYAEEDSILPGELSANVGFTSDYRFRGISQTDRGPAIQGGIDWAHDTGFYLGAWGSNVAFGNGPRMELDLYGGYGNSVGAFSYDLGLLYYWYPGASNNLNQDFYEIALNVGYDFEVASVSGTAAWTPENFGDTGPAFYFETGVSVPLPLDVSFDASIGYQLIDNNAGFGANDYLNWSLGLSKAFFGLDVSLAYIDTDDTLCGAGCGATVVLSVSKSF